MQPLHVMYIYVDIGFFLFFFEVITVIVVDLSYELSKEVSTKCHQMRL